MSGGVCELLNTGRGLTVIVAVTKDDPITYTIVTVPAVTPATIPLEEPMVATDVALLLQVPPASGSLSVIVLPAHTVDGPVIGLMAYAEAAIRKDAMDSSKCFMMWF